MEGIFLLLALRWNRSEYGIMKNLITLLIRHPEERRIQYYLDSSYRQNDETAKLPPELIIEQMKVALFLHR